MRRIKELVHEAHQRSLWQVLAVYIGASFAALEAVDLLIERIGLPDLFFPVAFVLLAFGAPIIFLTALVQSRTTGGEQGPGGAGGGAGRAIMEPQHGIAAEGPGGRLRKLLTWRNAIGGGVVAFAVWGVVAAAWFVSTGGPGTLREVVAEPQPELAPTSVAVLYFEDFSEERDLGYLADGFTEALIHELAQVGALRVISRNGVKPYRNRDVPIDSIARALNVGSLVEGSIERLDDRLRVTVQLIDGSSGMHLVSRQVERRGEDLLGLREDVVQEAAWLLRERLGEEIELRERRAEATDDEAWELVQQAEGMRKDAEALWDGGDKDGSIRLLSRADSLLALAERRDPEWPEPVVVRGWVSVERASRQAREYGEYDSAAAEVALAHAERSVQRWPNSSRARAFRGKVLSRLWEQSADPATTDSIRSAAERDLRLAVELDPKLASAWAELSRLERKSANFAAARLAAEKAYRADAYLVEAAYVLFNLCHISIELKEFDEAARWCDEGQRRFPGNGFFIEPQLVLLASAIGPQPDVAQAWELYERMLATYPPQRRDGLRGVYMMYVAAIVGRAGLEDSARAIIEAARSRTTSNDPTLDYYEANVRLRLGEPRKAVALLAAFLEKNPSQREYLGKDWWWEELHDDPEFRQLVGLYP